jgi:ABC-2 type transport system permease protein
MNYLRLLYIKIKLFMREYVAVFFTLIFCPLILLLFGSVYGNTPSFMYGGNLGTVDVSIPAFTGLILCGNGIISFPIAMASSRDNGELRRYKMTPLSPMVYLSAEMAAYMLLSAVGIAFTVILGKCIYHTKFSGNIFYVIIGLILSELAVFSCGMLVASISKNGKAAQAIGMIIGFPMMFLSGASMPIEVMPQKLVEWAKVLPLYHQVQMMRSLWIGKSFLDCLGNVAYLILTILVCGVISLKFFKWESGRT